MVLSYRATSYVNMGPRTTVAIKWLRRLQLFLRILQLNGSIGLLVLLILVTNIDLLQSWIVRISVRYFPSSSRTLHMHGFLIPSSLALLHLHVPTLFITSRAPPRGERRPHLPPISYLLGSRILQPCPCTPTGLF